MMLTLAAVAVFCFAWGLLAGRAWERDSLFGRLVIAEERRASAEVALMRRTGTRAVTPVGFVGLRRTGAKGSEQ